MQYDVVPATLMVGARPSVERQLCRACMVEAVDAFLDARCYPMAGPSRPRVVEPRRPYDHAR